MMSHVKLRRDWRRPAGTVGVVCLALVPAAVATAGAAAGSPTAPGWSIAPAAPMGIPTGTLLADSCTSPTSCVAVGSYIGRSSAVLTLAESWNGTIWKIDSTPNPANAPISVLDSVSCPAANACTAVGLTRIPGHSLVVPLAEAWNGVSWAIQTTPRRRGTGVLDGVSCRSATVCTAVGTYNAGNGNDYPLAEAWNGTSWELQTVPNPTSAGSGTVHNVLNGVSCSSPSACTAVGSYTGSGNSDREGRTLVEAWNGTTWTIQPSPNPNDAHYPNSFLYGVSCTSPSACTAVGDSKHKTGFTVLAEQWNGTSWKIQTTADPKNANNSHLVAVSCSSPTHCTAIGNTIIAGVQQTLAESLNGSAWTVQPTANPTGTSSAGSYLYGVSCGGPTACSAVGAYYVSTGSQVSVAEGWTGTGWKLQSTPNQSDALTNYLNAVSCSSAGACMAVGTYYGFAQNSPPEVLAEVWNGTKWSILFPGNPPHATNTYLNGVSCASATKCIAVGTYENSAHIDVTLAEIWNGTTWTIQPTPNPNPSNGSQLSAVSCRSVTLCVAVGNYATAVGSPTFSELWNGTKWTLEATASPAGATGSQLSGVSCTSATACTAVGGYSNSSVASEPLVESWDGTTWTVQATPSVAGGTYPFLYSVSCSSGAACTAVGTYNDASAGALIEMWNGTNWTIKTPPTLPSTFVRLSGVSCTAANACTAAGDYTNSSSVDLPLAEAWNGTDWTIQATPSPSGASGSSLVGVSCTAATVCTGVGNYTSSSGVRTTLVETEAS